MQQIIILKSIHTHTVKKLFHYAVCTVLCCIDNKGSSVRKLSLVPVQKYKVAMFLLDFEHLCGT